MFTREGPIAWTQLHDNASAATAFPADNTGGVARPSNSTHAQHDRFCIAAKNTAAGGTAAMTINVLGWSETAGAWFFIQQLTATGDANKKFGADATSCAIAAMVEVPAGGFDRYAAVVGTIGGTTPSVDVWIGFIAS